MRECKKAKEEGREVLPVWYAGQWFIESPSDRYWRTRFRVKPMHWV